MVSLSQRSQKPCSNMQGTTVFTVPAMRPPTAENVLLESSKAAVLKSCFSGDMNILQQGKERMNTNAEGSSLNRAKNDAVIEHSTTDSGDSGASINQSNQPASSTSAQYTSDGNLLRRQAANMPSANYQQNLNPTCRPLINQGWFHPHGSNDNVSILQQQVLTANGFADPSRGFPFYPYGSSNLYSVAPGFYPNYYSSQFPRANMMSQALRLPTLDRRNPASQQSSETNAELDDSSSARVEVVSQHLMWSGSQQQYGRGEITKTVDNQLVSRPANECADIATPTPSATNNNRDVCISSSGADNLQLQLADNNTTSSEDNRQLAVSTSRKSTENFGQRTSIYRGVTKHRWTGRFEAHLWDNSCKREGQTRKGRQVYLGGYDSEEKAARAYDLAALKYWGPSTTINFPLEDYKKEMQEMRNMSKQELVASLRRKSSGFSRGASMYRGVTRHHQHGRWQARIGRVAGNKDLYLGTFSTQEEAAEAYDVAAIKFRGMNAVTNFDMSRYDVEKICSNIFSLPGHSMRRASSVAELMNGGSIDANSRADNTLLLQMQSPHLHQLVPYTGSSSDIVSTGASAGNLQEWQSMQKPPLPHETSSAYAMCNPNIISPSMWTKMDQERANFALHTGLLFHHNNTMGPPNHGESSRLPQAESLINDAEIFPHFSVQPQQAISNVVPFSSRSLFISGNLPMEEKSPGLWRHELVPRAPQFLNHMGQRGSNLKAVAEAAALGEHEVQSLLVSNLKADEEAGAMVAQVQKLQGPNIACTISCSSTSTDSTTSNYTPFQHNRSS
ncbi:hypothetical protein GOP47_0015665 [Adiantum capillus-veneris]|uniref:AP2/ERF domain-containing protein n=1 Tax=Adiantum capillus-veneris TaxID=13818 RepID=A0A9D4UK40_ADICA|nr:hypothetical protein GOP47_0015665 [Adiantum capillus-veneris]